MDIVAINIENEKLGRVWNFESEFGSQLMMRMLELHLGAAPIHNYFKEDNKMVVLLTNEQLQTILDNSVSDPTKDLFLRDIWYLKTGEMLFEQTDLEPDILEMINFMKFLLQ
jgi:hypothetical protein